MRLTTLIIFLFCLSLSQAGFTADEKEQDKEKKPVAYHSLSPSLITNVQGSAKYIRCDVQLMTRNSDNIPEIELHAPAIRHDLLLLLSEQQGDELKQPKGKEQLRKAALKAIRARMEELSGDVRIDDLYFTSYFVQ